MMNRPERTFRPLPSFWSKYPLRHEFALKGFQGQNRLKGVDYFCLSLSPDKQ
jgi:hypothetical protein